MTSFYPSTALVVVDPSVGSYQKLVNAVSPGTEVVVLDAERDGVEEITEVLTQRRGIGSLHILSHGEAGLLQLGNASLSLETIEHYVDQLQSWAGAIAANADIVLYGCRVAAEAVGQQFVRQLSRLTGANIAASTTLTGNHKLGGDWNLEFTTGEFKSPLAFAPEAMAAYPHVLMASIFLNDPFNDATVNDPVWQEGVDEPGNPAKVNPFLTARPGASGQQGGGFLGNPAAPNPPFPPLDAPGSGVLRLTNASLDQAGYVLYNRPFPSSAGLRISFDFYMYGGNGADGISFFLIDAGSTTAPKPLPTTSGAFGGSLGYAQRTTPGVVPGILNGYVGLGFDAFGNYSNPTEGRNGGVGFIPDAIALRGSQSTGYAYLTGTGTLPYSLDVTGATPETRATARRRAEITLSQEGLLSVRVDANNNGSFEDPGETPAALQNINIRGVGGIDNGAVPELFTLGFAASTGSAINAHEISNLLVETLTAPPETVDITVVVPPGTSVDITGKNAIDSDGTVVTYRIETIPPAEQGTLFLRDPLTGAATAIAAGTNLTPDQAKNQIFFQAAPGFTGASYTYTAIDNLNAIDETPATVSLVLPPPRPNDPPSAGNFTVEVPPGTEPKDLPAFPVSDPNPGDVVTTITITSLPSPTQGVLYFGNPTVRGEQIDLGETLTPDEADQIFFLPNLGFTGGTFTYSATDNNGAISPVATVTLVPDDALNQAPTAQDGQLKEVQPQSTVKVPELVATDPDGIIQSFTITNPPPANLGRLLLNGTPVGPNTVLTPEQAGQLSFEALADFTTPVTFNFIATDNLGAASGAATFTVSPAAVIAEPAAGCRNGVRRKGRNNRRNRLNGTSNRDTLTGGNRNDRIRGKGCPDMIVTGSGNDRAFGGDANDMIKGGLGNDRMAGNDGSDRINAGVGRDRSNGGPGNDTIFSRRGHDFANGKGGNDVMWGERGNDTLRGGANSDDLEGRQNNDVIRGDNGNDRIYGNLGRDRIFGGQKGDEGRGGRGDDNLKGQGAADALFGQRNNDVLVGGSQPDTLIGGGNRDTLTGGGGADLLRDGFGPGVYDYNNPRHGLDTILGFQISKDKLDFKTIFNKAEYGKSNKFSYIREIRRGANTLIRIDANGDAAGGFVNLAVLQGVNPNRLTPQNYIV